MLTITPEPPTTPDIAALLAIHFAFGRAHTPAKNAHVLDAAALAAPDILFLAARIGGALAGVAALRTLGPDHGEVKSMRTHSDFLRRGVGRALLDRIVVEARARGFKRLHLETGTAPAFDAANWLYEANGFVDGPVFGGYPASPHNRFMVRKL